MPKPPAPPPEARLLKLARLRHRPSLSIADAAAMAGVSVSLWRQVEAGYSTPAAGIRVPKHAPADTLALMSRPLGITPAELVKAGREDAAAILAELQPEPAEPAAPEPVPEPAAAAGEDATDAVVTFLKARRGEPGVWAELRDFLARAGLFADPAEAAAWPPGDIPAELTPKAEQILDDAAKAGTLFRDEIGTTAARIGSHSDTDSYPWPLRVRMITRFRETARETARNPTRARRAG